MLPAPSLTAVHRKGRIDACLPGAIAAYIEWLVTRRTAGSARPARRRRACRSSPTHLRALPPLAGLRRDLSRDYTQALEARNIPHLLVGSKSFYHREEVETLRAALAAIEWPDDELSVFATLRGSLFAIPRRPAAAVPSGRRAACTPSDARPGNAPGTTCPTALCTPCRAPRQSWRICTGIATGGPFADTINALLEATRAHAGFTLRRAGPQAWPTSTGSAIWHAPSN